MGGEDVEDTSLKEGEMLMVSWGEKIAVSTTRKPLGILEGRNTDHRPIYTVSNYYF